MKLTVDKLARILGVSDVSTVTEVSLPGQQVQDTGSLAACLSLKELHLEGNRFTVKRQLEGIFLIPYLERLDLSGAPVCKAPKYREYVISHCPPTLTHLDNKEVRPEERKKAQAAFPDARAKLKGLRDSGSSSTTGGAKGVADIFSNTLEKKKKRSVSSAASGSLFGDDFVIPSAAKGSTVKADDSSLQSLLLGQSGGKAKKKPTDGGLGSSAIVGASVFGGEDDLFASIVETRTSSSTSKSPRGARLSQSVDQQKRAPSPPKASVSLSGRDVPIVASPEPKDPSDCEDEEYVEGPAAAAPAVAAAVSLPSSIYDEVELPEDSPNESSATANVPAADDLFAAVGEEDKRPPHVKSSLFASEEDTELFGRPSKENLREAKDSAVMLFEEAESRPSTSATVADIDDASMDELFGKPASKVSKASHSGGLFDDPIIGEEAPVAVEEDSGEPHHSPAKEELKDREEDKKETPVSQGPLLPDLSHVADKDLVLWVTEFLPNVEVKEDLGCSYGFVVDGCYFIVGSEAGALTVDLAWKEETEAADCVVTCTVEGLLRMAGGRLASPPTSPEERLDCTKDALLERLAHCLDVDREQWAEFLDYKLQEEVPAAQPQEEDSMAEITEDAWADDAGIQQSLLDVAVFCQEVAFHGNGMSATVAFFLPDESLTLTFSIEDKRLETTVTHGEPGTTDAVATGESSVVLAVLQGTLPLALAVIEGDLVVDNLPQFLIFATALTFSASAYERFHGAREDAPSAARVVSSGDMQKSRLAEATSESSSGEDGTTERHACDEAAKASEEAALDKANQKLAEKKALEDEKRLALAKEEASAKEAAAAAARRAEAAAVATADEEETAEQRRAAAEAEKLERERAEAERLLLEQEEKERSEKELQEAKQRKFAEAQAEERRVKEAMARKQAEEKLRKEEEEKMREEENKLRRLDPWYDIRKDNPMLVALVTTRVPQCHQPNHGTGSFMFSVELQEARCSIVIDVEDDKVAVSPTIGSVRVPECALRCSSAVMQSVLRGETSVQVALMTGQVLAQTGLEKLAVFTSSFDFSLPVPELDLHPDFSLPTILEEGAPIPAPARDSSMGHATPVVAAPAAGPSPEKAPAPKEVESDASEGSDEKAGSGEPDPRLSHAFHFLLEAWKGCSFNGRVLICVTDDPMPNVVVSLTPSDVELLPSEDDDDNEFLCELRVESEVLIDLVTGVRDIYQLQELGESHFTCKEGKKGALEKFCSAFDFSKSRYREFIIRKGLNPDDEFDSAGEDQRLQEANLYIPHCLQLSRVPKSAAKTLQLTLQPSDEDDEACDLFITIDASRAKDGHAHSAVQVTDQKLSNATVYCTGEMATSLFLGIVVGTVEASSALMEGKMVSDDRASALKFFQCFKFLPRNHSKFVKALRAGTNPLLAGQGLFSSR